MVLLWQNTPALCLPVLHTRLQFRMSCNKHTVLEWRDIVCHTLSIKAYLVEALSEIQITVQNVLPNLVQYIVAEMSLFYGWKNT